MPSAIAAVFLQRFFFDFLIRISGFMAYKHTFFVRKLLFLYNFHLDLANLKSDLRFALVLTQILWKFSKLLQFCTDLVNFLLSYCTFWRVCVCFCCCFTASFLGLLFTNVLCLYVYASVWLCVFLLYLIFFRVLKF